MLRSSNEMKLFLNKGVTINRGIDCLIALPSTGNVGQIAADSIVSTLSSRGLVDRVGCIESSLVLPMSGYDQQSAKVGAKLCLPIEVFVVRQSNIVIILQRSLCVKGAQRSFCEQLLELIRAELGCKSAVVLSGASTEDIEPASCGNLFAVSSSGAAKDYLTARYPVFLESLNQNVFPKPIVLPAVAVLAQMHASSDPYGDNNMYSAGQPVEAVNTVFTYLQVGLGQNSSVVAKEVIAQALCEVLPKGMTAARCFLEALLFTSQSVVADSEGAALSVAVLGKICAEGDNTRDGVDLAVEVMYALGLLPAGAATSVRIKAEEVSLPASWAHKYGAPLRGQASNMFY